jgi:hypothetical protein
MLENSCTLILTLFFLPPQAVSLPASGFQPTPHWGSASKTKKLTPSPIHPYTFLFIQTLNNKTSPEQSRRVKAKKNNKNKAVRFTWGYGYYP